jgi:adenosylcobinamide-phosphate synthase
MLITTAIIILAVLLDAWLGEPRLGHPLVLFRRAADWLEARLNRAEATPRRRQVGGALATILLLLAGSTAALALSQLPDIGIALQVLLLYLCLGGRSLSHAARRVARPLAQGQTDPARRRLAPLVRRDVQQLSESGIAGTTVEAVLKKGSDAVFATLFWFVVTGAAGAVLHRLACILAAQWDRPTSRFQDFGSAARTLTDVLGYVPARLTALSLALVGNLRGAVRCWYRQGRDWRGLRHGPVLAAGAGALGIRLGGDVLYAGEVQPRPVVGCGRDPRGFDIERSLLLLLRALILWIAVLALLGVLFG